MAKLKTTSVRQKEQEDEQLFVLSQVDDAGGGEDDPNEDEEGDDQHQASHAQLLSDMMKISKKKKVRQEVRTSVGSSSVDTCHLLTRLLPSTSLRKDKHSHTLSLPVEKSVARRIKRAAGFENVAMEVNKWAKVVKVQREAEQLRFPLKNSDMSLKTVDETESLERKTPLEQEVYSLLQGAKLLERKKETKEEQTARKAVSLDQIKERNRELWRQKEMKRRYEHKARLMNKSKSRKYHRLLRREKLKKQKTKLEELQKTDPEAALQCLEELDRARIEERMSLRHKTSKWAHLQGFRATRDKTAMAALRENQRLHQELTTKTAKTTEPQDSEEEEDSSDDTPLTAKEEGGAEESHNPWIKHLNDSLATKNVPEDETFTRFKKFWEEVNKRKQTDKEMEEQLEKEREKKREGEKEPEEGKQQVEEDGGMEEAGKQTQEEEKEVLKEHKVKSQKSKDKLKVKRDAAESENNGDRTTKKNPKKKKNKKSGTSLDTPDQEAVNIDDLFDEIEIGIKNKVKRKLKKLGVDSKEPWIEVKSKKKNKKLTEDTAPPEIEEFDFTGTHNQENINETKERAKTLQDLESLEEEGVDKLQAAVQTLKGSGTASANSALIKPKLQVDPNKFLQVEGKRLMTALPDSVGEAGEAMDDEEEKEETAENIMREAFADDYLMEEFSCEKAEAIQKGEPGSLSLALPGWGDWTGPSIKMSNRKVNKFRLRVPHVPRKDSHLGHVLYNEEADVHTNLRKAMVSDLPYMYKSVKDFEASVRAPVGRMFVPETAYKRMTAPPIVTKMGTVIQPMTEDELLHCEVPSRGYKKANNTHTESQGGRKRKAPSGAADHQKPKRKGRQGEKKGSW